MTSRLLLNNPTEFRRAYEELGKPRFALTEIESTNAPNFFLQPDEYLLGDSIVALIREALGWEEKACSILWSEPTNEEIAEYGPEIDGSWYITDVPDFVNDVFVHANFCSRLSTDMSQEELQEIVLPELAESNYGFLLLERDSWDDYLQAWDEEIHKQHYPELYRAKLQRFIIEQRHSYATFEGTPEYGLYSNAGIGGKITKSAFKGLGLRYEDVAGMEGVVNGLDEIIEINGMHVPATLP